jgi:hypothetical protein
MLSVQELRVLALLVDMSTHCRKSRQLFHAEFYSDLRVIHVGMYCLSPGSIAS